MKGYPSKMPKVCMKVNRRQESLSDPTARAVDSHYYHFDDDRYSRCCCCCCNRCCCCDYDDYDVCNFRISPRVEINKQHRSYLSLGILSGRGIFAVFVIVEIV
jgi:hypothetical protein